ncbi:MAG: NADH-quinone oxidoreductase subunit NuoG [Actinomycetota bacterium]
MSPEAKREITLIIDGREVAAPEGEMLVDAAKYGDVEIPIFCYEPKLGQPVGACRMCLVEIEGTPKLQTACSTPVRDGMVVYTQTDQVKEAQNAVVEFLLVNHPLDCPVCDKGGECPLQDIAMGWGPGRSRSTDPKRHFQKPLPLSPLIAIDRERCILCYRCVRFSQEISEDSQLQLLDRGDRSFVGTFDDRPYIAPFHGNITELCPVGALTSYTYRFRARPWDIEQGGSICTLCPSQCNVGFTVRDEQVKRVLARDNPEVDDGWLCDKGRYSFEMLASEQRITAPQIREGGNLREASWAEAIERAAAGLREAGPASAAIVGDASNEEGYLVQRIMRQALGSPNMDSRPGGGPDRHRVIELSRPELSVSTRAIDDADAVLVIGTDPLHASPILDLRIRKAVRRNGVRLAVANERPTALDGGAEAVARYAPGGAAAFLAELNEGMAVIHEGGEAQGETAAAASLLCAAGRPVIVWGERLGRGEAGPVAVDALLELARGLGCSDSDGAGLLGVPETTNARGLREVGVLPDAGPGLTEVDSGRDAEGIRAALEADELRALLLFGADPVRDHPGSAAWDRALKSADFVVAFAMFEDASAAQADVILPLQSHAEKEGTITHPDGRLQRVRPNVEDPGQVRPVWEALCELAAALDHETGLESAPDVLATIAKEVPIYAGITAEEIGGRGVRWQERDAGGALPEGLSERGRSADGAIDASPRDTSTRGEGPVGGELLLGTYRDLWATPVTELNPPLRFLAPQQRVELAPADAQRLGLEDGDEVSVAQNGTSVGARVAIRERMGEGACFLIEGTAADNANALLNGGPVAVEITKVGSK